MISTILKAILKFCTTKKLYNVFANLLLKLLYVIYFANALAEIYILIVIFKLGAFFLQIGPNIALFKVKWDVAK